MWNFEGSKYIPFYHPSYGSGTFNFSEHVSVLDVFVDCIFKIHLWNILFHYSKGYFNKNVYHTKNINQSLHVTHSVMSFSLCLLQLFPRTTAIWLLWDCSPASGPLCYLCLQTGTSSPQYPHSSHSAYFVSYCFVTTYHKFSGINIVSLGQEFKHGLDGSSTQGLMRLQPKLQWAAVSSEAQLGKTYFPAPSSSCRIQLF